ncbi:MAG: hypothetical protein WDZ59_00380 [Pirellulales bacterium]
MSIREKLNSALAGASGGGPYELRVDDGDLCLDCHIASADPLAVSITRLELTTNRLARAGVADLQRISEQLAGRITYLLEPIGPIESDSEQCVVQMRSSPPQQDDDGKTYYELLIRRGGSLALARYQQNGPTGRHSVPAVVTREVLLRLAGDFAAVLE